MPTNPGSNTPSLLAGFTSFQPGLRLIDGTDCYNDAYWQYSYATGITANPGTTQATGTKLTRAINEIATSVANGSIQLPVAVPGMQITVINETGQTLNVFGAPSNPLNANSAGDVIAANNSNTYQPTATGVTHANTTAFTYVCWIAGKWKQR